MDFDYKFNSAGGPDKWGVSIGQAFDWPGVYGARREAAGYRAEALGRLYRGALLDRAYEVKQLRVKLSVARSHMSTLQQAEYAEQQLAEAYAGAFDRGEATILDVSKIRLHYLQEEVISHLCLLLFSAYQERTEDNRLHKEIFRLFRQVL